MRQAEEANGVAPSEAGALNASERQELIELRRKLHQVQMERDILAKATAYPANKPSTTGEKSGGGRSNRTAGQRR